MAELEDETQAGLTDSTTPEDAEETVPGAEHNTVPKNETGDEADGELGQQKEEDDKFGMLHLAGESQEHDPGEYSSLSFDVVAVHGLYGDRKDTWTADRTEGAPDSNWLKDQIYTNYASSRIVTFGYDASCTRAGISTMAGIREKALRLLDDLVKLRKASRPDNFRPLVFISHDLGGIIVKEALCIATLQHGKYRSITASTQLLIFFGCPHRCTSTQDMEDKVANLLFADEIRRFVGATGIIEEMGRSIIEINGSFAVSSMLSLLSIVNVYSEKENAALQIFDKYTATLDVAFEKRIASPKPHKDMCKFSQHDDIYKHIDRALSRHGSLLRPNYASVECLQTLQSLAAPVYPLESAYGPRHRFSWIGLHETYTKWLDSYGPSILHVHGTAGVSDASEYIFQCLDEYRAANQSNEVLVYFAFKGHDDRCNSVVGMLNTLLAQILNHHLDLYIVRSHFEQMSHHGSWTQAELLLLFKRILGLWGDAGILCVINGLDECNDSRMAFLKDLCSFVSLTERRYKIAITSTADSVLQATLADWPTINLDDHPKDSDSAEPNLASDIDLEVLELMQERPVNCDFEKTLTEKFLEYGRDKHQRRLVLNQLRLSKSQSTKSANQLELDLLLLTTSKDMYARILAMVPFARRVWARKAFCWILYAFRPLRIWELGVALALEVDTLSDESMDLDEIVYQHFIADLENIFGGMVIVKHTEVHFSHTDVRDFLLAADCEQEHVWYDVKKTAHREITDSCHFYLSLQQVQDLIASSFNNPPTDPLESPTLIPQHGLHVYAIKYWPRHYKLIPETFRPTKRVLRFVQNIKVMRCWAEAYWWFSNPTSRTDRAFKSMLPIFASLGLQDLLVKWLDLDAETPEADQDRALGLVEAARNAHVEVVCRLLLYSGYNQASLQGALVAGVSSCDEAVLDELITYAAENFENFEWPPAILCRAAQFGLTKVVKKLLRFGASLDMAVTFLDMTPLYLAAREGHAGVINVLLEYNASLTAPTIYGHVPLHTASAYGHAAIVKLLIDAGADVNVVDAQNNNAMFWASLYGNYTTVEILAEAGCDMGCDKQGNWSPLIIVADLGFVKSARFLLEKKANTEVEGPGKWTPLRYAALAGHVELCRLLLKHGANSNALGGEAPILSESASNGNLEVVKLLVENGATVDAVNSEGWTALHKASVRGHTSVVIHLLDHGADINHTNKSGQTSLLLAAESSFAELVQLLINREADLHCATNGGWTPIHLSYDHVETTRVLMQNGADGNRVVNYFTPLYLAAANNYLGVVKVLLSFETNLEIQYANDTHHAGFTALTIATMHGYTGVVRLLLEAGANVNHQSKYNNFPLQYAVIYNREDVLRTLMEYHPNLNLVDDDGDTALHCISSTSSLAIVKLLINGGSNLETQSNKRLKPLCRAVMSENLEVVKYLIAKKADLSLIGGPFGGPLHVACRWSNLEIVKILVAAGANVNLVDPFAGTPVQSACLHPELGEQLEMQESIIRYLINEAKADVTTVGGLHGCALNAACRGSTPEMVRLITAKGAKIEVEDGMGRVAIHFAAAQSLENFQLILDAGADVEVKDKMGRTAIHWAVVGGLIDVVERVLSLSRGLVDQADIDGWTPLLWVARGCGTYHKPATSNTQEEVIKLLLDRGADPCVRGKGLDREWSPVKVARYHGVDDALVQLLMAKAKEKLAAEGENDTWDEVFHASGKALKQSPTCDSCDLTVYGINYNCETCLDFDLCYKCYRSRHLIHLDHPFKMIEPEYEPVVEKALAEEGDEYRDDDDDDEDIDSDDTDDDDESKHEGN